MREGKELKAPRHASAAATRDGNLLSRDGRLPYVTAICLIPDIYYSGLKVSRKSFYILVLLKSNKFRGLR